MSRKQGNLKALVLAESPAERSSLMKGILLQMLSALTCLHSHHIPHVNLKPTTILWDKDPEYPCGYRFFLSWNVRSWVHRNTVDVHPSKLGEVLAFKPPEFWDGEQPQTPEFWDGEQPQTLEFWDEAEQPQTTKMDIWSLFAIIVWTYDPLEFQDNYSRGSGIFEWIASFAQLPQFSGIRGMVNTNPETRPSAYGQLQLLLSWEELEGQGLEEGEDAIWPEDEHCSISMPESQAPYYEPYPCLAETPRRPYSTYRSNESSGTVAEKELPQVRRINYLYNYYQTSRY